MTPNSTSSSDENEPTDASSTAPDPEDVARSNADYARSKKRYQDGKEYYRVYSKEYYRRNRARILEQAAARYAADPERFRAANRRNYLARKARDREAQEGTGSPE